MGALRCGQFRLYPAGLHHHAHLFQQSGRCRRPLRGELPGLLGLRHLHRHPDCGPVRPGAGHHLRLPRVEKEALLRLRAGGRSGLRGFGRHVLLAVVPGALCPGQVGLLGEPGHLRLHAHRHHPARAHGQGLRQRLRLGLYRQLHPLCPLPGAGAVL